MGTRSSGVTNHREGMICYFLKIHVDTLVKVRKYLGEERNKGWQCTVDAKPRTCLIIRAFPNGRFLVLTSHKLPTSETFGQQIVSVSPRYFEKTPMTMEKCQYDRCTGESASQLEFMNVQKLINHRLLGSQKV
jgi:hypothetical protein